MGFIFSFYSEAIGLSFWRLFKSSWLVYLHFVEMDRSKWATCLFFVFLLKNKLWHTELMTQNEMSNTRAVCGGGAVNVWERSSVTFTCSDGDGWSEKWILWSWTSDRLVLPIITELCLSIVAPPPPPQRPCNRTFCCLSSLCVQDGDVGSLA